MVRLRKILTFCQKPNFLLGLILLAFFLKGLLLVSAFPIFGGQDESRHYNTIQYLSEPKEKTWPITVQSKEQAKEQREEQDKDDLATYRYSEEIQNTATATDTDALRGDIFNTIAFSENSIGLNENEITARSWKPYNFVSPADMVGGTVLYHKLGTLIEKAFATESILVRFYLIRIFSVLLGTFVILLAYLTAKKMGFSARHSLLLTAIISFQPKFSFYYANINYDMLLILMFALFTYAGVLTLKDGPNWKNIALLVFSIFISRATKPTGTILLVAFIFLLAYLFYKKFETRVKSQVSPYFILAIAISVAIAFALITLSPDLTNLGEILTATGAYLGKSFTLGRLALSARTYWGTLSWTNSFFMDYIINFIWLVEFFSLIGLSFFFFGKNEKPKFLPEKKYLVFLVGMIVALQLGIRVADWSIFQTLGKLEIGAPGRYFLPNLTAHIILVFSGLGMLFTRAKKETYFDNSLLLGAILMLAFSLYLIFDVIIFRFYL